MKIMIMLRLAIVFFLIVTLSQISFAKEIMMKKTFLSQQEEEQFFADVEDLANDPALAIISAESQFLAKKMLPEQFDSIVMEQSNFIVDEEQPDNNQMYIPQESYFAKLLSPLSMWYYGYTKEEQQTVRQQINQLQKQRKVIQDQYDLVKLDDDLNEIVVIGDKPYLAKDILLKRYAVIIAKLDNEISQLQMRIGDVLSVLKKRLITGAVATFGLVGGAALMNKFYTGQIQK